MLGVGEKHVFCLLKKPKVSYTVQIISTLLILPNGKAVIVALGFCN
jgi:hypothetical protein